jgi:hypothetical protein
LDMSCLDNSTMCFGWSLCIENVLPVVDNTSKHANLFNCIWEKIECPQFFSSRII